MTLPALLMQPILKERVWGGRRLERLGKHLPAGKKIGESWELADLPESIPDGRTVIANGQYAGARLHELIDRDRRAVMGSAALSTEGRFPLLIKLLDAAENLSVQVHPTPEYAARHPGTHVKSEAWVVLQAEPGSVIYAGLREGLAPREIAAHIRDGTVVDDLNAVPARVGDCHYLPSGTCHALGAGIVVAEVQTPSDTTFRVYDWGREGRELHIAQALECLTFGAPRTDATRRRPIMDAGGFRSTPLCRCDHFEIERIQARPGASMPVVTSNQPEAWIIIDGAGRLEAAPPELATLSTGSTWLFPASLQETRAIFDEPCTWLRITLPSPTRGAIAR